MLADIEWGMKLPNMKLKAISSKISYHTLLVLELESHSNDPKPFHNLDAWFSHLDFTKLVNQEWQAMGRNLIVNKFHNLKAPLRRWNKEVFGNIDSNITKYESELGRVELKIENDGGSEADLARIHAIKGQLKI